MAYIPKYMTDNGDSRAEVNVELGKIETAINSNESKMLSSKRFYNRTYTGNSSGNVNTTFPLPANSVVIHNLISVIGSGNPQAYQLHSFVISNVLWFKLMRNGVEVPNTEFTVNYMAVVYEQGV